MNTLTESTTIKEANEMHFDVYYRKAKNKWGLFGDHVYVTFADGTSFKCHGDDSDGTILEGASGVEDLDLAKAMNAPMRIPISDRGITLFHIKTYEAGIIYGFNGGCHTMANRIIVKSGKKVSKARGDFLSSCVFGEYGIYLLPCIIPVIEWLMREIYEIVPEETQKLLKPLLKAPTTLGRMFITGCREEWIKRLEEHNIPVHPHLCGSFSDPLSGENGLQSPDAYMMRQSEQALSESKSLIQQKLGADIDTDTQDQLLSCLKELNEYVPEEKLLKSQSLAELQDHFVSDFNQKVKATLSKARHILNNDEDYEKLFNAKPEEDIIFLDQSKLNEVINDIKADLKEQFKEK
jgi:hypothetical protein